MLIRDRSRGAPILVVMLVALSALVAASRRAAAETVVLIAPPRPLEDAVRRSLAPWRIEVVVVGAEAGAPEALAAAEAAGFVAWREGGDLIFWDTARSHRERRAMAKDLDEAGAASLALSIKTWMRLPPPPVDAPLDPPPGDGAPPPVGAGGDVTAPLPAASSVVRLRADVGVGVRHNLGEHDRVLPRASVSVLYGVRSLQLGAMFETGTSYDLAGSDSTHWSHHVIAGQVRWPFGDPYRIAVVPVASVGVVLSSASGMGNPQGQRLSARGTSPWLEAGVLVERRWRWLAAGLELGLGMVPAGQELKDRSLKVTVPAHVEPRAMLRLGVLTY